MKNSMMILVLLLSFLSCENKNDKLHLTIMNQSTTEIENVKLYTYYGGQGEKMIFQDSLIIGEISIGQSIEKDWDLSNMLKADGSYYLVFKNDSVILNKKFGYYTNGILIEKKYNIVINDKDIIVTQ